MPLQPARRPVVFSSTASPSTGSRTSTSEPCVHFGQVIPFRRPGTGVDPVNRQSVVVFVRNQRLR
jgi:hypothetical protein